MRLGLGTLSCLLVAALAAVCQPAKQLFEAADVRVSSSTSDDFAFLVNGRVEVRGVTMLRLISSAYSVPATLISGGPSWHWRSRSTSAPRTRRSRCRRSF